MTSTSTDGLAELVARLRERIAESERLVLTAELPNSNASLLREAADAISAFAAREEELRRLATDRLYMLEAYRAMLWGRRA